MRHFTTQDLIAFGTGREYPNASIAITQEDAKEIAEEIGKYIDALRKIAKMECTGNKDRTNVHWLAQGYCPDSKCARCAAYRAIATFG